MLGQYVTQPKFCGGCGRPLLVTNENLYDRQTGEPVALDAPYRLDCPEQHEAWGRTLVGTWAPIFERN